jgi:hypothetical protein
MKRLKYILYVALQEVKRHPLDILSTPFFMMLYAFSALLMLFNQLVWGMLIWGTMMLIVMVLPSRFAKGEEREEREQVSISWWIRPGFFMAVGSGLFLFLVFVTQLVFNISVDGISALSAPVPVWYTWFFRCTMMGVLLCFVLSVAFSLYWSEWVQSYLWRRKRRRNRFLPTSDWND